MEDRWRKLENTDIDDDKDVMYYRAHVGIKDLYANEIFERMQKLMETDLVQKEKDLQEQIEMKIFGVENTSGEVTKVMDSLASFRYQLTPNLLLLPRYNSGKISSIISSLNSNGYLWGTEAPEIVKSKDEQLEILAQRLEEHVDGWINHLDDKLLPELQDLS